ncbi:MAG: MFS transporter [Burkholderiaceae bacterium]|nr:MAG: MFS transporter [Burkholderiaceae bacterium]TAM05429.1 MAG: MFS transporter [Pusillimonas sp.]
MPPSNNSFNLRKIALAAFGPSLLFGVCEGAIYPIIALSARALGASIAISGIILALIGVGSLISNIPASILTAIYGERRCMVSAAAFSVLALLLCVFAHTVWMLAVGVLMIGMAQSVFLLARQTYLTEAIPISMRARALSTLGGVMRVGLFIGPFIAAGLMQFMGIPGAYWTAIIAVAAAGVLSNILPDLEARTPTGSTTLPHPSPKVGDIVRTHKMSLLTLGGGCLLVSAMRACRQIVIPLWAAHIGLDATTTALVYGLMGSIDMLLFYPAGHIMDRHGRHWVAIPSMLIMGLSFILMPLTTTLGWFTAVTMLMGFGNGVGSGINMTIGADASPSAGRTQFLGIWRFITDVGTCGGPVLMSATAATISLGAGIVVIGGVGFAAAAVFWKWLPRTSSMRNAP